MEPEGGVAERALVIAAGNIDAVAPTLPAQFPQGVKELGGIGRGKYTVACAKPLRSAKSFPDSCADN